MSQKGLMMRIVAALVFVLASSAGFSQTVTLSMIPPPPDVAAPPADATKTASGLAWKVLTPGSGKDHPAPSDTVTIHYTGWTTDGKMFDSSVAKGRPSSFRVNGVIPGLGEGLQLMVVGEKARLWIPEDLAYKGGAGHPAGLLVFDVELIKIPKGGPSR